MIQFPKANSDFLTDFQSHVSGLGGPTGTGKTFTLAQKMLWAMTVKRPYRNVRNTSFLLARATEGDVRDSIIKDLEDEVLSPIKEAGGIVDFSGQYPIKGLVEFELPDKTVVHAEITGMGLEDQPSAKKKLKSKKYTIGICPEIQTFYEPGVVGEIHQRVDRIRTKDGGGIYWDVPLSNGEIRTYHGGFLWFDFNYTDKRHWFYRYAVSDNIIKEDGTPTRAVYEQPSILLPVPDPASKFIYKGEAVRFVPNPLAAPYIKHCQAKDDEGYPISESEYAHWLNGVEQMVGDDASIDENIMGTWGYRTKGRPVYPTFSVREHVLTAGVGFNPSVPLYVGVDGGFNNAWVFGQEGFGGRLNILAEINNIGDNAKPVSDALDKDVIPLLNSRFFGAEVIFILDESMLYGEGAQGNNQAEEFWERNLTASAAPTQNTVERIKHGGWFITTRGALAIDKDCEDLISALAGGYSFGLNRDGTTEGKPDKKSPFSHIGDAYQYLCCQMRDGFSSKVKKLSHNSKRRRTMHRW